MDVSCAPPRWSAHAAQRFTCIMRTLSLRCSSIFLLSLRLRDSTDFSRYSRCIAREHVSSSRAQVARGGQCCDDLPGVLGRDVSFHSPRSHSRRHVSAVHQLDSLFQRLRVLHVLDALMQLGAEPRDLRIRIAQLGTLRQDFALHPLELQPQIRNGELERGVVLVVPLQLLIHLLDLLLHLHDLHLCARRGPVTPRRSPGTTGRSPTSRGSICFLSSLIL